MLKFLSRGLAAFLLVLASFSASALSVTMAEQANGEGWKQFSQDLVDDKLMVPGADRFQSVAISNAMYNMLTEAQKATVSRVGFHRLNALKNNLPDVISVAEFRRIAGNLQVPDVQVVAQAAPATPATAAPPAAATPAAAVPKGPATATVVTTENVEQKLAVLATTVERTEVNTLRRIEQLQTELRLTATVSDLKKVAERIKPEVQGMFEKLDARLKVVETDVSILKGEVAALKGAAGSSSAELASFQGQVAQLDIQQRETAADVADLQKGQTDVTTLWNWVYGLTAAVAVLLVGVAVALWRRPSGDTKVALPTEVKAPVVASAPAVAPAAVKAPMDPEPPFNLSPLTEQGAQAVVTAIRSKRAA